MTSAAGVEGVADEAGESTSVADTSVKDGWEGAEKGEAEGDAGADGNGKGEPGENAALLNWSFCVFIWPITLLKACCTTYFWKLNYWKLHNSLRV